MSSRPTESLSSPALPSDDSWDWFSPLLVIGVFVIVGYVVWAKFLSESNLTFILGIMVGWITDKVKFKWGSSVGSKVKDATITNLSK